MSVSSLLGGLKQLLAPELCYFCWKRQPWVGSKVCLECSMDLPLAIDTTFRHNNVTKHLWGRVEVEHGAAVFNYWRDSPLKTALHMLKYRGKRDVGLWFGRMTGKMIKENPMFDNIDAVVYVPLDPAKQRRRGYNQARVIAEGILPYLSDRARIVDTALLKTGINTSQTSMTRRERLANVESVYALGDASKIRGKSVLLVDDVMTTGATVEVVGRLLREAGVARLYVVTAAVARM